MTVASKNERQLPVKAKSSKSKDLRRELGVFLLLDIVHHLCYTLPRR